MSGGRENIIHLGRYGRLPELNIDMISSAAASSLRDAGAASPQEIISRAVALLSPDSSDFERGAVSGLVIAHLVAEGLFPRTE